VISPCFFLFPLLWLSSHLFRSFFLVEMNGRPPSFVGLRTSLVVWTMGSAVVSLCRWTASFSAGLSPSSHLTDPRLSPDYERDFLLRFLLYVCEPGSFSRLNGVCPLSIALAVHLSQGSGLEAWPLGSPRFRVCCFFFFFELLDIPFF